MSWIQQAFNELFPSSILTFFGIFILLASSAYIGKYFFQSHLPKFSDDQAKIILGAILSLLGLLIGFVLSISIGGYNERQKTEENEMIAIGTALQRTKLLEIPQQEKAEALLHEYLDSRINFFKANSLSDNKEWRLVSIEKQNKLWDIAVFEANKTPTPVMASVLTAYSDLHISQERTIVSWRDQIPNTVWFLLIFFAIASNFLIGYNARKDNEKTLLILVLPFLITLALFIISEIDIPGKGVIHVTPDNLILLKETLMIQQNKASY